MVLHHAPARRHVGPHAERPGPVPVVPPVELADLRAPGRHRVPLPAHVRLAREVGRNLALPADGPPVIRGVSRSGLASVGPPRGDDGVRLPAAGSRSREPRGGPSSPAIPARRLLSELAPFHRSCLCLPPSLPSHGTHAPPHCRRLHI